jgi:hypothetical protein
LTLCLGVSGDNKGSAPHWRPLDGRVYAAAIDRMRSDGLGETWRNICGIPKGDGTVPVGCVSSGAIGSGNSHDWQRRCGAVLYHLFQSWLQRHLRDVARSIYAANEHTIRRQCQDTLADISAMHAGGRMVGTEPKCPCRRVPDTRRRLDEGLRYWREGRGECTMQRSASGYRRWTRLVSRLPERPERQITGQ